MKSRSSTYKTKYSNLTRLFGETLQLLTRCSRGYFYRITCWIIFDVVCKDYFWRANDNYSALFAFFWSLLILIPSFLFWLTFFYFRTGQASSMIMIDNKSQNSS